MFPEERYVRILDAVRKQGAATVADLSRSLGVSAVTIRRDLEKLEARGSVIRTHGGVMSTDLSSEVEQSERSFKEKNEALAAEKERIAFAAASLIKPGESIMLTPGTTNMRIAKCLAALGTAGVSIVTNAANIAVYMLENSRFDVILLGGKMRPVSYGLVGTLTEQALKHIRVDKLFLGVDGFDLEHGMTTPSLSEASVNRLMIGNAREVIVPADHTKFGVVTLSHIAPANAAHRIISDSGLDEAEAGRIRSADIQLVLV